MRNFRTGPGSLSSDLKILVAATVIGAMSLLMLGTDIAVRLGANEQVTTFSFWIQMVGGFTIFVAVAGYAPLALREMRDRRDMAVSSLEARHQVEQLFKMTDMLQSANGYGDANAVLRATAAELLPGFGGALYVFNNSRDRLDLSVCWDWTAGEGPTETVSPTQCWALKRGKPHLNRVGRAALLCEHHPSEVVALEIPMMARGEVYGLFLVQANAEDRLDPVRPLATAIADAMSLALSNIALREKLSTLALRDPLTGLYNRRYMEDVLERYSNLAQRNGSPLSVIMIDLDHFKLLNDEHGHAMGDAVLREVASSTVGAIRPSDVASVMAVKNWWCCSRIAGLMKRRPRQSCCAAGLKAFLKFMAFA